MNETVLSDYAFAAIEELKVAAEWDAYEEAIACRVDYEPKDAPDNSPVRALILLILRGESPEGIYIYFQPNQDSSPKDARANIDEIKRQIKAYLQDERHRYEWPVAFGIIEVRNYFPRTYEDWSPEEEFCYSVLLAKGKEREELAKIFQRVPGVALTPPNEVRPAPLIDPDSAINLLGIEVRCGNCHHSTKMNYALLAHAARKSGADISSFMKHALAEALKQFKCRKCGMKTARIDG
jgi:hypothetical protein